MTNLGMFLEVVVTDAIENAYLEFADF